MMTGGLPAVAIALGAATACGTSSSPGHPSGPDPGPTPTANAGTGAGQPAPLPPPPPAPAIGCGAGVPQQACAQRGGLRICKPGDRDQVGEWRYAIVNTLYSPIDNLELAQATALWRGGDKIKLVASRDSAAALEGLLGAGKPQVIDDGIAPRSDAVAPQTWAIVAADQLSPRWQAVAIDGVHPLDPKPNALAVPLCGPPGPPIRNIDPSRLTALAMTGTTALTRGTSKLMELKGVLYPLRDVQPWLATMDLVHISNEVSLVPTPPCDTGTGRDRIDFCEHERYIELLEKAGTKIVEMTGSHLPDYGWNWIGHTVELYRKRGWIWFGGGTTEHDNTAPRTIEHNGNKLVFIGCNMPHTVNFWIKDGPGVAPCDMPRIAMWIADYRRRGYVPIVSIQHSEVMRYDPPPQLVRDLRAIAKAGPAFVMGSQAHCPHPWEFHRGAYVHYGPGNFLFDQDMNPLRDSAQDKLYIHGGKLLAVAHLYARLEEAGRPRPMTDRERAIFVAQMERTRGRLARGNEPDADPELVAESRARPESFLVKGVLQHIVVISPPQLTAGQRYRAVIELGARTVHDDDAFVVTNIPARLPAAVAEAKARELLLARYPVDADKIVVHPK